MQKFRKMLLYGVSRRLDAPNVLLLSQLALGTEKRRSLRLHDANHFALRSAAGALVPGPIIHAVMILVAAHLVERIAIRPIAKRRTFIPNRRIEHLEGGVRD